MEANVSARARDNQLQQPIPRHGDTCHAAAIQPAVTVSTPADLVLHSNSIQQTL